MQIDRPTPHVFSTFGYHLVDKLSVETKTLNLLFAALLLTILGVFITENLLLRNQIVFWPSFLITLYCIGIVLIFYSLSRFLDSIPWALLLVYALLWLIIYSRAHVLFYFPCLIAACYAIRFLRLERSKWLLVFLMAALGTASILGVSDAYTSFDMLPRLHSGNVTQDTLFHVSIAAMIKNYGVVSTGLHGLIETPYHAFSHFLMAAISYLSGVSVIEVYGVANWVLFAPLLLFCVVGCIAMIDRDKNLAVPLAWGFAALLLTVLPYLFIEWAVWDSFFVSESYLVSLGIFLLSFAMLFKHRLTMLDLLYIFISGVLITESKGSVGLIYCGLWFTRFIFVRESSTALDCTAFISSALTVGWALSRSAVGASDIFSLSQLNFVADFSRWGSDLRGLYKVLRDGGVPTLNTLFLGAASLSTFIAFHFILSWIVIWQNARHNSLYQVLWTPIGAYTLVAMLAGLIICFAVALPSGAAYYFSNIALFVSLPSVVSILVVGWGRHDLDQRLMIVLAFIVIVLIGTPRFGNMINRYPTQSPKIDSLFITKLHGLKDKTPLDITLSASAELIAMNPIDACAAQPFVFPAVSERVWMGVITPKNGKCSYQNYGYQQYKINPDTNQVTEKLGLSSKSNGILLISR